MSSTPLRKCSLDEESRQEEEDIYVPPKKKRFNLSRAVTFALVAASLPGWFVALHLQNRSNHKVVVEVPGLSSPHPYPPQVFERVKKVFRPDERYIGPSNQTHHMWDHLVAGHDALYIEDPDRYGLMEGTGPPFHHENMAEPRPNKFYVISILHQMHCLNLVRFHYWQVKGGHPVVSGYSEASWDAHMDHCFEYLRQAISCGAGFAIEGHTPLVVAGEHGEASTVTGWGLEHSCINFEALRAFQIDQERKYNMTWQQG